jgi:hypothetical protein
MLETDHPQTTVPSVLTLGRSDRPLDHFLNLLKTASVEVVVDTHSCLCANFAPQPAANHNPATATAA